MFTAPSRLDALAAVDVPTLIAHGTEDPIFPYDHGEALARAIPGSTFVTWQGVGHEIPAPLGADLIDAVAGQHRRSPLMSAAATTSR